MSEIQPIRFGRYLLLEKIASGGMAQVYRGKILGVQGFEKLIAVKTILPHLVSEKELVTSFIDEAKLAALLSHQNIVQIYDFGSMEDSYFIAMEYLFGKDLRAVFRQAKERNLPLGLEYALYITSRVCAGLDYAHKLKDFQGKPLNLIHRDISPQNIFITYEGEIKILDFGIAKAASQSTVTQHGMIKGKVAYMSPEQASGHSIDHRSDLFSTGILLYEMVTGKAMFTGDTMQILAKVREAQFEPPESVVSTLPPKLYDILRLALAKDPKDRYQSCGQMLTDLEECLFALGLHPTSRGFAHYMKLLFEQEIATEGEVMEAAVSAAPEQEQGFEKEKVTAEKSQEEAKPEEQVPSKPKKRGFLYGVAATVLVAVAVIFAFWPREKTVSSPAKESPQPPVAETSKGPPPTTKALAPKAPEARGKEAGIQARVKELQKQAAGLMEKNPGEARTLLLKAVELDPKNVRLHSQLGLAYMRLQDYSKAIGAYQKATELDPQFTDAYFNLGYIYAMKKDYSKSEDMYARTVKLAPSYLDEALYNLSIVQEKQGKKKESIENLEKALKINPQNEMAKKLLNRLKKPS
jgi:serine/threonine protein kinase